MRPWLMIGAVVVAAASGCETSECGDDFRDLDGRCLDPKASCDTVCLEHEVCDTTVTPNACNCATGFARLGGVCRWAGVVGDASFLGDTDDEGEPFWVANDGAVISDIDNRLRGGDGGEAFLRKVAVCNAATVRQELLMPSLEDAGQLVADVTYSTEAVHGLDVGFGATWRRLPPTGGNFEIATLCLGEGAYWRPTAEEALELPRPLGGSVPLTLSASEKLNNVCGLVEEVGEIRVDRINVRPLEIGDPPCPTAANASGEDGTINGTANVGEGGWSFECTPSESCVPGALDAEGANPERGTVARIARDDGDESAHRMGLQVSVPSQSEEFSPALVFWWQGTNQELFPVTLGANGPIDSEGSVERARDVETLVGTGGGRNTIYCLPPWTEGVVLDLAFALPTTSSGAVELLVDDVRIVQDPACGSSRDLADPGFESAPNRWLGTSVTSRDQRIELVVDPSLARVEGEGVLEMSYGVASSRGVLTEPLAMQTFVRVPATTSSRGPAVGFYVDARVEEGTDVGWRLGVNCFEPGTAACGCRGSIPTTGEGWRRVEACLPPEWEGRWHRVEVFARPPLEAEGSPADRSRVLLDDFEVFNSPACDCE
ncbi:MAG: hypothetical protein AAF997_06765 [Myxococcota bacterium]